VKINYLIN